jgi:hypothetical protein
MTNPEETMEEQKYKYPAIQKLVQKSYSNGFYGGINKDDRKDSGDWSEPYIEIEKQIDSILSFQHEKDSREFEKVKDMLKEIIECPHDLVQATIPQEGIERAPEQVVYNYSIAYLRIEKAKKLLYRKQRIALKKKKGEA